MKFRLYALMLTACATAHAAPVPKELKADTHTERLKGVWKEEAGWRWYFDGEKLHVGGSNTTDNKGLEYKFTLLPNIEGGEFDFGGGLRHQYYAIYKFEGDNLRIAYSSGGKRPKDFTARGGEFHHVLKRVPGEK